MHVARGKVISNHTQLGTKSNRMFGQPSKKNCFCIFFLLKKKTYFLNNKTIFQFIFNKLLFFKLNTARVLNIGRLCARRSRGLYTNSDLVNLIATTFTQTSRITPRHWTHLFSRVGSRHRPIQYFPLLKLKVPNKTSQLLRTKKQKKTKPGLSCVWPTIIDRAYLKP